MDDPAYVPTSALTADDPNLPPSEQPPNPEDVRPNTPETISFEKKPAGASPPSLTVDLNEPGTTDTTLEVMSIIIGNANDLVISVVYKPKDKDSDFKPVIDIDGKPLTNVSVPSEGTFDVNPEEMGVVKIIVEESSDPSAPSYDFTVDIIGCTEVICKFLFNILILFIFKLCFSIQLLAHSFLLYLQDLGMNYS